MARLITNHDPYHIHKIFGMLAFLHFIFRGLEGILRPISAFNYTDEAVFQNTRHATTKHKVEFFFTLIHLMLSWTSLLLPVPRNRVFAKPMIWREFRAHSICFATRQILALWIEAFNMWPEPATNSSEIFTTEFLFPLIKEIFAKSAIVCLASFTAGQITNTLGSKTLRTTNSMPYPEFLTENDIDVFKFLYRGAQYWATVINLVYFPVLNFAVLYGIQGAAFLMTLVRKGKITAWGYHVMYTCTLLYPFLLMFRIFLSGVIVEFVGNNSPYMFLLDYLTALDPKMMTDPYDPRTYHFSFTAPLVFTVGATCRRFSRAIFSPVVSNIFSTATMIIFYRIVMERYVSTEANLRAYSSYNPVGIFFFVFCFYMYSNFLKPLYQVFSSKNKVKNV